MGVYVQDVDNIVLGVGELTLGGTTVGQLKGDVTFTYKQTWYEVKAGFPQQTLKRYLIEEAATLSAGLLELQIASMANVVPGFTATGNTITAGGKVTLTTKAMVYTCPRDDGGTIVITFPKAQLSGDLVLPFHEASESIMTIEIGALVDTTALAGAQLFSMTITPGT